MNQNFWFCGTTTDVNSKTAAATGCSNSMRLALSLIGATRRDDRLPESPGSSPFLKPRQLGKGSRCFVSWTATRAKPIDCLRLALTWDEACANYSRPSSCRQYTMVARGAAAIEYLFEGPPVETHRPVQARPQLILLNLSLSKSGAMQVLRRIKSDERTRQIPVIVLAAAGDAAKIEESRRLGADTHISKPVDFRRFFEATLRLDWHWALFKAQDASSKPHAK